MAAIVCSTPPNDRRHRLADLDDRGVASSTAGANRPRIGHRVRATPSKTAPLSLAISSLRAMEV